MKWSALVVAVAVVAAFVAYWRGKAERRMGFREMVKNPSLWRRMIERRHNVAGDIAAAGNWDDEQIARAVRSFVFADKSEREAWAEKQVLASLGPRVHAPTLGLLRDSSLRDRLVRPNSEDLLPEAPFHRACSLLEDDPKASMLDALGPFLSSPQDEIRSDAALVIGSIGTPECMPPLRTALTDAEDRVRACALIGIERANEAGRLDWRCKEPLAVDLKRMLGQDHNSREAAKLLVEFDAEAAQEFFLSPAMWNPSAPAFPACVDALAGKMVAVPEERLRPLLEALEQGELDYARARALAATLRLLGQRRNPSDREYLTTRMAHSNQEVARGAAKALMASLGLEGFRERLWKQQSEKGWESLTPPQRVYSAVVNADGEINNGGLSQYFFNSSGERWREALNGFTAIGCKGRAEILREAVAKFGSAGPAMERDRRQDELASLARENDKIFDALDSRYYACTEVVEVAAKRYVIEHAEAFR